MTDEWEGFFLRNFIVALVLVPTISIAVIALFLKPHLEYLYVGALVLSAIYIAALLFLLEGRRVIAEYWTSNRRFYPVSFQEARARLEDGLAASGLPYEEVAVPNPSTRARFEVGRGLGVELLWTRSRWRGWSAIYLWPVNDRTRRDVENLKRRIDAAFPPAK